MKCLKCLPVIFFFLMTLSMNADDGRIVLRLMGDSTMADKDLSKKNPERGWGMRLPSHLDSCVTVVNYAQNGRSTKSFISRGLWDRVKADLQPGDRLFIQFGHNDSKESDPERYAPAFGLYTENMEMFVEYALSKGAEPVIFSPVSRRWFDEDGNLKIQIGHADNAVWGPVVSYIDIRRTSGGRGRPGVH